MIKKHVLELAEIVERSETFGMRRFFADEPLCGTPSCIAGHAEAEAVRNGAGMRSSTCQTARRWLDITNAEADRLFEPIHLHAHFGAPEGSLGYITRTHAAAVLRHFADTGEIDWRVKP